MNHHKHEHEVNETRKRSLVKAISFRIIEFVVDVIILLILIRSGLPELMIAGIGVCLLNQVAELDIISGRDCGIELIGDEK